MKHKAHNQLNKGFTLVELMVVLTLLSIVLMGLYTFFDYAQRAYSMTNTQSVVQDDVNNFLNMLANDIRSAARPDESTKAIVIYTDQDKVSNSGSRIDIFDYRDGKYYKTSYKYENEKLLKGSVQANDSHEIHSASLTYMTVLDNVRYPADKEIFEDITRETDGEEVDRRTIRINLMIEDEDGNLLKEFSMPAVYTSRTKGLP